MSKTEIESQQEETEEALAELDSLLRNLEASYEESVAAFEADRDESWHFAARRKMTQEGSAWQTILESQFAAISVPRIENFPTVEEAIAAAKASGDESARVEHRVSKQVLWRADCVESEAKP